MQFIEEQVREILKRFPEFKLIRIVDNILISGVININCCYLDEHIIDEYEIEIIIKPDFPDSLPIVREVKKRIPLSYGHIYRDGELCLAPDEEVRLKLGNKFTLNEWLDKYVIPYFFGFSYYEKYNVMPFGERSHGNLGIKEFYKEFFDLTSVEQVMDFINAIGSTKGYMYRGHIECPCGSGKKARNCHKDILIKCQQEDVREIINSSLRKLNRKGG